MRSRQRFKRSERGAALIAALIFVLMIFALMLAALSESQARVRVTGFEASKLQAYNTAETGLRAALARLKNGQDPNLNGSDRELLAEPPDNSGGALAIFDESPYQPDGAPDVFEDLRARRILFADEPRGSLIVRARELPPNSKIYHLRSMAAVDGVVRVLDAIATPTGAPNIFAAGIGYYAADSLTIGGDTFFDSYDSSTGGGDGHNPSLKQVVINGVPVVDAAGKPVTSTYDQGNVTIGANSVVTVNGGSQEIYGQLQFGPLGSAAASRALVAPIKGPEIDLPSVSFQAPSTNDNSAFPSFASRLDAQGNLSLAGGPQVSATVGANSAATVLVINDASIKRDLIVRGDVTLYVRALDVNANGQIRLEPGASLKIFASGSVALAGQGLLNGSARPEKLQLYSSGSSIDVSGSTALYGVIYAPRSAIAFAGNTEVFGAVIGRTIRAQGTHDFHFDESLAKTLVIPAGSPTDYELSIVVEVERSSG